MDPLRARARAWHALALAFGGELTAAQRAADEIRTHAIPVTAEAACLAALGCAQVSLARDDLLAAQRLLDEADGNRAGDVPGEPSVTAIRTLIQARVLLADGDPAAARAAVARLHEGPRPVSAGLAAVVAATRRWRRRCGPVTPGTPARCCARTASRAPGAVSRAPGAASWPWPGGLLLAEGDFRAARAAAAPCLDGAAARTRHERIRALLATAVAARRLGEAAGAAAQISEALGLAEPEGDYRVFLDGGLAVRSAVTVLVPPTSRYAGFVSRVLERFDSGGPGLGGAAGLGRVLLLTHRERAVLRFLPSHMTNEEISEALFLSVNTVKTHLRSAYRKLGVRSRREAIARGRRAARR